MKGLKYLRELNSLFFQSKHNTIPIVYHIINSIIIWFKVLIHCFLLFSFLLLHQLYKILKLFSYFSKNLIFKCLQLAHHNCSPSFCILFDKIKNCTFLSFFNWLDWNFLVEFLKLAVEMFHLSKLSNLFTVYMS